MDHLQTRPGLKIIGDNLLASCEVSPWADKNLITSALTEESGIRIPIFAIRYNWLTAGIFLTKKPKLTSPLILKISLFLAHVESSMNFPTGPRQPSQHLAEDLIAACTPEGLMGRMYNDALQKGCPIHSKHYVGHATDVTDPPLSNFFMHQLERPRHFENFEIPERKSK